MPIAARQVAKIIMVPPANSGSRESTDIRSIASAAPTAAANAEPVQNGAASNFG